MKKLTTLATALLLGMAAHAAKPISASFLDTSVRTAPLPTAPTNGLSPFNGGYGGITISNAAAAPLGGFTNIADGVGGTNALNLTWTNNYGIWVRPTNNVPGVTSGIQWVNADASQLVQDIPLWTDENGMPPFKGYGGVATNAVYKNVALSDIEPGLISNQKLYCKMFGGSGAAGGTMNLIFVGLVDTPQGFAETTDTFQWGIATAAGSTSLSTNLPSWRFPGCAAIRLKSATLTTTTAANIQETIQVLQLNGFIPSKQ